MRIDRLTIQNFNGFESCEITFNPHFNLLVGDNASGKTSILDALSILLDTWVRGIKGDEAGGGIDPAYIRLVSYQHGVQDEFRFEKQLPVRIEATGDILGQQMKWARERARENGGTRYAEAQDVSRAAHEAGRIVRDGGHIILPLVCSYGVERLWFETPHRKSRRNEERKKIFPSRLDGYKDCNRFTIEETALLNWVRAEVSATQQKGEETTGYKAMRRAVLNCIEGATSFHYDERYKDAVIGIEQKGYQLFSNLSAGQRIMLTLVGDLVRRAAMINPHLGDDVLLKTPGVVLIDELDLHLHPIWQRRVIRDLKRSFPAIQFIATTHSPQLIGEAQPEELRVLADGGVFTPPHSFGLDSSRVLEEIQGAVQRNSEVESLIRKIAVAIDKNDFDSTRELINELEEAVGSDDVEVTRARSLLKFMEAPL
jgi:predicted ATP-binding protein involved in virulence